MTDSWKTWLWRTLVTAAILIVIAACFYAVENARGVRAWEKCERELAARGESLDWSQYMPAPVPDGQNFYKAPMMTEWFVKSVTNAPATAPGSGNPETTANDINGLSASNYLVWSATFSADYEKIRAALKRPAARMDGDYTRPFYQPIQNFVNYRIVSQVLAHRAKCHLLLGEPDQALDDLTLLHGLNRTIVRSGRPELLLSAMIHSAITGLYANAIACGIESRGWREPELAVLQNQLAEINLLPVVADSFRHERAGVCHMLDVSSLDELFRKARSNTNLVASDLGWWFVPSGWVYQNKAIIATLEGNIINCMDLTNNTVSPYKAVAAGYATQAALDRVTPYNFIAALCVPNFTKATEAMARNQTWVEQAHIVCALERFRLANGKYPGTLAALVPQFLEKTPTDIINGSPMIYRRTDADHFKLYAVGWDEADDGGITAHTSDGKEDLESGDWVWHYPAF